LGQPLIVIAPKLKILKGDELIIIQRNSVKVSIPHYNQARTILATITGYSSTPDQTDSTPLITASGNRVKSGIVACPRYLEFGTVIEINGKIYICDDRTHPRLDGIFDIWFSSKQKAKEWGKKKMEIIIYQ